MAQDGPRNVADQRHAVLIRSQVFHLTRGESAMERRLDRVDERLKAMTRALRLRGFGDNEMEEIHREEPQPLEQDVLRLRRHQEQGIR
jgi:hypothetical protein